MSKTTMTIKALMAIGALCAMQDSTAQVMLGYRFSVEEQNYDALENPIVISKGLTDVGEDNSISSTAFFKDAVITDTSYVSGYPIGFNFKFGDQEMTGFGVSGTGFLIFTGDEAVTFDPTMSLYSFTTEDIRNICGIAVKYIDMGENSIIGYSLSGEEGERVLSVELDNILVYPRNWSWSDEPAKEVSILYKVYEKDNSITMTFEGWNGFEGGDGYGYIGIKQTKGNALFLETEESWADATTTIYASSMDFGESYPVPDGLTFRWDYPLPCVTPAAQPSDLQLVVGTDYVAGEFLAPDTQVDRYLAVITKGAEQTFVPEDGVTYAKGDELGGTTVIYWGEDTNFLSEAVEPNTQYTLSVYAANSIGSDGPAYLTASPLQQTFVSAPEGPVAFWSEDATTSSISFSVEAMEGFDVLVLMTDEVRETGLGWNSEPYFGIPTGDLQVGDYVPGTRARVVWRGGSQENVVVENLEPGTGWYLEASSIGADGTTYSSDMLQIEISTVGVIPYVQDFSNVVYPELPVGWDTNEDPEIEEGWFRLSLEESDSYDSEETYRCIQALGFMGTEEEPAMVEFTTIPVYINQPGGEVALDWCWQVGNGWAWFAEWYPVEFVEGDQIELAVSEDGEEWTPVKIITSANAPAAIEDPESGRKYWNTLTADLSEYEGKTIFFRFQCCTVQSGSAGNRLYVRNFQVTSASAPEVPELRIEDMGVDYAILVWKGSQDKYELEWGLSDSEDLSTVEVEKKTYTIENLEGATSYKARVRGYDSESDSWTEWSDYLVFTTNDWPAVSAPEGLKSEIKGNNVILSWDAVEEALSYEVRYRKGSETVWTNITDIAATSTEISGLDEETTYLWTVRANCTHDRQTGWASQEQFVTGLTGISSMIMTGEDVEYYSIDGQKLGYDLSRLPKGSVVIATDGKNTVKVIVK